MKILVLSCDKNEDLFLPFKHCMEKYWEGHPKIYYSTETIKNPYYETINVNIPLEKWTTRIIKTLEQIDDEIILTMIDDNFIREKVDIQRLKYIEKQFNDNVGSFNLEKSFDKNDLETHLNGFKKRSTYGEYKVSIMCSMWRKKALIDVLKVCECDPWQFELNNRHLDYDYYINSSDQIINWGYEQTFKHCNLKLGKWCREIIPFFEKEKIKIDYSERGWYD